MNITTFYGANRQNGYMSNWYMADFTFNPLKHNYLRGCDTINNYPPTMFLCNEQFMMFCKARLFKNFDLAEVILQEESPRKHKQYGRNVTDFCDVVWSTWRYDIVLTACLLKFSQNPDLEKRLVETGNSLLIEASPHDRIWGVGLSDADPRINNPEQWNGLNLLGKALMETRDILQARYI